MDDYKDNVYFIMLEIQQHCKNHNLFNPNGSKSQTKTIKLSDEFKTYGLEFKCTIKDVWKDGCEYFIKLDMFDTINVLSKEGLNSDKNKYEKFNIGYLGSHHRKKDYYEFFKEPYGVNIIKQNLIRSLHEDRINDLVDNLKSQMHEHI